MAGAAPLEKASSAKDAKTYFAEDKEGLRRESQQQGQNRANKPGDAGGGPLVEATVRSKFADTAKWVASLTTDKTGVAEVELDMPENLTSWKIRVWGMGHGTKVGSGEADVVTRKNLIVRLQAPRFFVQKDEVVLSANVHNYLKTAKDVSVSLEIPGNKLRSAAPLTKKVKIPAGGEMRVDWLCTVLDEGEAVVRMKGLTDEESDAMEMKFPVFVHGMLKTDSYSGVIRGAGAELFTDSIIALNLKNGKLRWYFQTTHHDIWDYDATNPTVLFDLNGKKAIAQAGKTGWVYILNRSNGKPLYGIPEKKVEQLKSVNTYPTQPIPNGDKFSRQCATKQAYAGKKAPDGKPYQKVGCIYTPYDDTGFVAFAPAALGGANWPPSAYSPKTGYLYICSKDSESAWRAVPAKDQKLQALGDFSQIEGLTPGEGVSVPSRGRIVAMNMRNNRLVWSKKWATICYSGMTATAGNLIFTGTNEGYLRAYNARTGNMVWQSPQLKGGVNAPVVTYKVNDKQYVAVFAGGNGIASLFGGSKPNYSSRFYAFAIPS